MARNYVLRTARIDQEWANLEEERIAKAIVDSAYSVHRALGPGLLEGSYETCFCHGLSKRGLAIQRQVTVPLVYDGITFPDVLRLDVPANDLVVCELKAVDEISPVHHAQLLSQLRLTRKRLGFLINFNVALIKLGIQRFRL